jgi:8-oxo-dGTP pyrophosphatase MutT (NUDIX family)
MLARETAGALEVFMLRRSARSAFLPEVFVFPGGAVDEDDRIVARSRLLRGDVSTAGDREPSEPAFEVAALREAFEEAGILLAANPSGTPATIDPERLRGARAALLAGEETFANLLAQLDVVLDARALWHFSRWITPPSEARRFDTHFYCCRAPLEQHGSSDEIETHDGLWIAPAEALRRNAAGTFPMIFPTIKHLESIAVFTTIERLAEYARTKPIRAVNPIVDESRRFSVPPELGAW